MTLEHQDSEAIAINAETARDVSGVRITLDVLTSAERGISPTRSCEPRGSAVLERPASCLLDLLLEADDAMPADGG